MRTRSRPGIKSGTRVLGSAAVKSCGMTCLPVCIHSNNQLSKSCSVIVSFNPFYQTKPMTKHKFVKLSTL